MVCGISRTGMNLTRALEDSGTQETESGDTPGQISGISEDKTGRQASDPNTRLGPKELYDLGLSHCKRFRRYGELNDIEKAVEYGSRAVNLTPDGHPDQGRRLGDLGVFCADRFGRLGEVGDLEKAIQHQSHALALTPDAHPDMSSRHANLGTSYRDRFRRLGEKGDLEKAIQLESHALALTPDGHPDLSHRHASLGVSYGHRFRHLGEVGDLENTIQHNSRALELTPDGHPDLSARHGNLGASYRDRFRRLGEPEDLEKAIQHFSRALALTPDDHPDLSTRHSNLGGSYGDRYRLQGVRDDFLLSSEHRSRALALTPDGHPHLSRRYTRWAVACYSHYRLTGDTSHLHHSLESFQKASRSSSSAPRNRFENALLWVGLARRHRSLNLIEACQTAINLLPQFIWLGATTDQRYRDLSTAGDLAVRAASAAIRDSDPELALKWLEHARCVVWNQSLMLSPPLDQLQSSHPDLAVRLQTVAKQLHDAGSHSQPSQTQTIDSVAPEHRHRLGREYNDLLDQARRLPGFEDFLQPMKAGGLIRAARNGPIVVINCYKSHCDALFILPEQDNVKHLPLPNFTEEKARSARSEIETSLRYRGLRERGFKILQAPGEKDRIGSALAVLWTDIVKPVLEFIGFMNNIQSSSLPHVTWCPTGGMSFLPLHAAGDYDQPRSRVFDYVTSSYTPTLTALLASSPTVLKSTPRVLAIGQANTPGRNSLPGATKELEFMKSHMQNKAEYSQLVDSQATTSAVLDAMEQRDWVHLACHAHQNVDDPTRSGFFLHDGTLDLASINRRSFKNKGLAFLSACQTAKGDEKLPDEAIHLASGMLMAGYPSVIATMWSVFDQDAPLVADKVYAELMKEGKVGNGEAGKALHHAVAVLRNKVGEKDFARWVPYIHIGS
ncbi:unnamed protein product [Rhizoctonia solani]|uniref:CHAT domain-containing protein n=1 Tax=Rhizoctonia solani TaxID=456999 RepID=A0A8H2X1X3_9AGAM|nr:unnamed protein product [Rhizoctonia solani]